MTFVFEIALALVIAGIVLSILSLVLGAAFEFFAYHQDGVILIGCLALIVVMLAVVNYMAHGSAGR